MPAKVNGSATSRANFKHSKMLTSKMTKEQSIAKKNQPAKPATLSCASSFLDFAVASMYGK